MLLVAAGLSVAVASLASKDAMVSAIVAAAVIAIGFVPMRLVTKHGLESLPAVWMGTTTIRLLAAIVAVAALIAGRGMNAPAVVAGVCGTYIVLLGVETVGVLRLVKRVDSLTD